MEEEVGRQIEGETAEGVKSADETAVEGRMGVKLKARRRKASNRRSRRR